MTTSIKASPKLGDVIEIPNKRGLVYAQYTHDSSTHGSLLRVFEQVLEVRPKSFLGIIKGKLRFSTFFPLTISVRRGVFHVVANEEIAAENRAFPVFRNGVADPKTKKVAVWWFWDGEKEWKVGAITKEQRKMPIAAVWNDSLLIERIEGGWSPENDFSSVP